MARGGCRGMASVLSSLNVWVKALQLPSRVFGGELPIDRGGDAVALLLPRGHLAFERCPVGDPAIKALNGEDAQLDLGDV